MKARTVKLGFEIDSGEPVEIPIGHLVVAGQTQHSGKTTALEALIERADVRAVVFVTKRGEGAFTHARRILPYFKEQADWQFVASILEASRGEKLRFERAWIIRASKGARTLADVHRNVKHAMETAKGLSADVYLTLDAYLDAVVPQIAHVRLASGIVLEPGLNAMDLTDLTIEMQHLVIKSTLDWVLRVEEQTVVVIPEAWKFIPQDRGTPVKLAAEAYVRQAAGLHNFLWLDSQDIGGIHKAILRSVPVWVLGVQRETNEIKRTLDNIPAGITKPREADIAHLALGQFYACWGRQAVKTYVQPTWVPDHLAQLVARGAMDVHDLPRRGDDEEDTMNDDAVRELRIENGRLRDENASLRQSVAALTAQVDTLTRAAPPSVQEAVKATTKPTPAKATLAAPNRPVTHMSVPEDLYQAIKARLQADAPGVIQVLHDLPEINVTIRRPTIDADGVSTMGRAALLVAAGFFAEPRTATAAWTDMKRRGFAGASARVYEACDKLTEMGFLTKEEAGYQAVPGVKNRIREMAET